MGLVVECFIYIVLFQIVALLIIFKIDWVAKLIRRIWTRVRHKDTVKLIIGWNGKEEFIGRANINNFVIKKPIASGLGLKQNQR